MKPNKATGPDRISPRVLKLSSKSIAGPLTKLMNKCVKSSTWPSLWKLSNVSPIHKKDSSTTKENYRPVSILTCISKVFEKIQYDQIFTFVSDLLSDNLSGFLKGHSCTTALLKMTEDFRASLDDNKHCVAVAIDLSKASDSVFHGLLVAKLSVYGFSAEATMLIKSYLSERVQRVYIINSFSDWKPVNQGVFPGSLLGPLLFNIFVNDLNYFVNDVSLRLYADDTTEYSSNFDPDALKITVQENLDLFMTWCDYNFMTVNDSKSKVLPLGNSPSSFQFHTEPNSPPLDQVSDLKLLGLTINSSQTFKSHVKESCKKVNCKVAALGRVRKFIP